jgi:hypothetical protein
LTAALRGRTVRKEGSAVMAKRPKAAPLARKGKARVKATAKGKRKAKARPKVKAKARAKPKAKAKASADRGRAAGAGSRAAAVRARGAMRSTAAVRERKVGARNARSAGRRASSSGGRTAALAGSPNRPRPDNEPESHTPSPTAVAAEALRTGIVPAAAPRQNNEDALPHEGKKILVGDPDDDSLRNEYVGEETPGGSTPTPDQSDVDEIGLAYGVKEEDSGQLRTSSEVLDRRDRRRRGLPANRGKI